MYEEIEKCPVCSGNKFSIKITCTDHMLSNEKFILTECANCSFLFTNPRPTSKDIGTYYKSDEYISHSNKSTNLINTIYKIARHFTMSKKVSLINSITNQKTILDYGCGTGDFLYTSQKNGWKITGFEPDKIAREKAIDLTKTNVLSSIEELKQIQEVSLITLWHVLEHITELNSTFDTLKSKLSVNGKFLIAVPNHESYDAILYKDFWAAYDVPRHLYHFSQDTMKLFLNKHGLKIYNTIPMKLDSYYVSLLSEKYKYGKSNYIKSFINGYKSNVYARKNQNNYSSIIYIAGK